MASGSGEECLFCDGSDGSGEGFGVDGSGVDGSESGSDENYEDEGENGKTIIFGKLSRNEAFSTYNQMNCCV
jgi:hypothetical protein